MRAEAKPFIPSSAVTPATATETATSAPNNPSLCRQQRKISHHGNPGRHRRYLRQCQLRNDSIPLDSNTMASDSHDHVTFPKLTNQKNQTDGNSGIIEEENDRKSQKQTQRIARRRKANRTTTLAQSQIDSKEFVTEGESNLYEELALEKQTELADHSNQSKRHDKKSRQKQDSFCTSSNCYFAATNTRQNKPRFTSQNKDVLMQKGKNKPPPNVKSKNFDETNTANIGDAHFSHTQKQRHPKNRRQKAKNQKRGQPYNEDDRNSISDNGNLDEVQVLHEELQTNSRQKQHLLRLQLKHNQRDMPHTTKEGKDLGGSAHTNYTIKSETQPLRERMNSTLSHRKTLENHDFSRSEEIADNQTDGTFVPKNGPFPPLSNKTIVGEVNKLPTGTLFNAGENCWAFKVVSSVQLEMQKQQIMKEERQIQKEEQMSGGVHLTLLSSHSTQSARGNARNFVDKEFACGSRQDQCGKGNEVPGEHEIEESSINCDENATLTETKMLTIQSPSAKPDGDIGTQSLPHTIPNAKLNWSNKEISNMRRRLWMAIREKRKKDKRSRLENALQKEKLAQGIDETVAFDPSDDSSASSLLSSLSSSSSSSSEDKGKKDLKQPPSLKNRPFDEVDYIPQIISQPQQHRALPRRSVLKLEKTCRQSQYPIHYIICHMAMIKNGGVNGIDGKEFYKYDNNQSKSTSLVSEHHWVSDEELVMECLLTTHDMKTLSEWRTTRMDTRSLFFEWRNNNQGALLSRCGEPEAFTNLLSANLTSMTPIQLAVYLNLPKVVRALLSVAVFETFGSPYNNRFCSNSNKTFEEDEYGRTALMLACELRHLACIEELLSATKVKTDHRDRKHGNTAFHYCCVESLSEMDSNKYEEPIPQPSSSAEAIDLLLNRTPQKLKKRAFLLVNRYGETILHLACSSGDLVLVECLIGHIIEHGQTFVQKVFHLKNHLGHVPFLSAVATDSRDVVSHILGTRSNSGLNYTTWFDGCPITVASSKCYVEMVRLLLDSFDLSQSHTIPSEDPVMFDLNNALIKTIRKKSSGDGSEDDDLFEIISLLVDHGANPHISVPSRNHRMEKDKTVTGDSPLCTAVTCCDPAVVKYMIDAYSRLLRTRQVNRRSDPILRSQPESYFKILEQKEWDQVHASVLIATAKSLFLHWRNQTTLSYGFCSLILYKRTEFIPQICLQWLLQGMKKGALNSSPNFSDTNSVGLHFEAPIVQYSTAKSTRRSSNSPPNRGDRTSFMQFSEVFLTLDWFSSHGLQCKWLLNFVTNRDNIFSEAALQTEEFYVVSEGEKLLAHKSICSAKCFKLAAAILFYEANERAAEFHDGRLLIRVELPLLKCKMLLSHIYHGSIVFGLHESPMKQCDQILEMALIAEEYLCPTLIMECEMRLLNGTILPSTSFNEASSYCICVHCVGSYASSKDLCSCPIRRFCLEDAENKCIENNLDCSMCLPAGVYSVIASSVISNQTKLITPESAMNVLAVADQLSQSSYCQDEFYAIKYCCFGTAVQKNTAIPLCRCGIDLNKEPWSGCIYKPFDAAKTTAITVMLRDFHSVMTSESFLMQVQGDNSNLSDALSCMDSAHIMEENAALLLRTCLDELAECQWIHSFFTMPSFCAEAKTNN